MKNKALQKDSYKAGKLNFNGYFGDIQKNPEMFANSDQFRKMRVKNRKKK